MMEKELSAALSTLLSAKVAIELGGADKIAERIVTMALTEKRRDTYGREQGTYFEEALKSEIRAKAHEVMRAYFKENEERIAEAVKAALREKEGALIDQIAKAAAQRIEVTVKVNDF